MILSDSCWMKDKCWKYINSPNAPCKKEPVFCQKLFRMDFLCKEALMTDAQRKHTDLRVDADGTDRDKFRILKSVEENIENFVGTGCNLYIYSTQCGNGKSSWAARFLQVYFTKIWHKSDFKCHGLFINVPRFLLALKDNISEKSEYVQHIKENVMNADLVVFDEIGFKSATQFEFENLLNIINYRIDACKSNIYTTNATPEELREKMGERLYSRVINCSTCVQLNGRDKRGIEIKG